MVNITTGQIPPPPLKGNPCQCDPYYYPLAGIPDNCDDYYIKNGCFECYDWFSSLEGQESPESRKQEQFECAIGGVTWHIPMDWAVPLDEERYSYGNVGAWFSPTYYTPDYFNTANTYPKFQTGQNWLNYHIGEFEYHKRYPNGWHLINGLPNADGSNNYGYAGFWAEAAKKQGRPLKNEYIQQLLKKTMEMGHTYKVSFNVSKNHNHNGSQKIGAYFSLMPPNNFEYANDFRGKEKTDRMIISFPPPISNPFNIK